MIESPSGVLARLVTEATPGKAASSVASARSRPMPSGVNRSASSYAASTTSLDPKARVIRSYGGSAGSLRSNIVSIDLENSRCRARSTDTTAITAAARASRMRWRTRNTAIRLAIGEPKGSWGERQGGEEADKIGDSLGRRGLGDEPTNQCQSYRPCQDGRAFCRDHRDADHQDCSFLPGAGRQRRPDGQPQERARRPFGAAANPPLCRHLRPVSWRSRCLDPRLPPLL